MISNLVVVGSGVMGRGIAYVGAIGGFNVVLVDVNQDALESARNEIDSIFEKGLRYQKITEEEAAAAKSRFTYSANLKESAAYADLIIEAVPEKAEIKRAVFETIEVHAKEDCYFATNTSTMSPTEIGSYGKRPEKTIAMHFLKQAMKRQP